MNKLLIVLLAVCLVNVHAFVKRDAPAPSNDNSVSDLGKSINDLLKSFGDQINESLNPEQIKKNFNDLVDGVQNSINKLKTNSESPK